MAMETRSVTARTSSENARDIPEATVARLPVYLRALTTLSEQGTSTCSSEELAVAAGVNSAKLRKDLSYLGSYGTRGVGYDVDYLRYQIAREIGVTQDCPSSSSGSATSGRRWPTTPASAVAASGSWRCSTPTRPATTRSSPASTYAPSPTSRRSPPTTPSRSASSRRRPWPPRTSPTGWWAAASPASSTSRRPCSTSPSRSTSARSTCRSSCRSWPTTSSARPTGRRRA